MLLIVFIAGAFFLALLLALSLASLLLPAFQFFPPPSRKSWQYRLFWMLFRLFLSALALICIVDNGSFEERSWLLKMTGFGLLALGFGMAFRITVRLGWRQAHGEAEQLISDAWFQYCRNPIYVFSIISMLGVALVLSSPYANWLLTGWALLYLLAPFVEEPWLEKQFGAPYVDYLGQLPRFIPSLRSFWHWQ